MLFHAYEKKVKLRLGILHLDWASLFRQSILCMSSLKKFRQLRTTWTGRSGLAVTCLTAV